MSFDSHLIHTCTVQRATLSLDQYRGQQRTYADYLTDVRCRLVVKSERIFSDVEVQLGRTTTYLLLVRPDVDVQEGDRITELVYEDKEQVAEHFTVREILKRRARSARHVALKLERAS